MLDNTRPHNSRSRSAMIECGHCGNYNRGEVEIDESGASVAIETVRCGVPWCGKHLCPGCDSFRCDDCLATFCTAHQVRDGEYIRCIVCEATHVLAQAEPACTCVRVEVDFYDVTGCARCNPGSWYNLAQRTAEDVMETTLFERRPERIKVKEMDLAARLRASLPAAMRGAA